MWGYGGLCLNYSSRPVIVFLVRWPNVRCSDRGRLRKPVEIPQQSGSSGLASNHGKHGPLLTRKASRMSMLGLIPTCAPPVMICVQSRDDKIFGACLTIRSADPHGPALLAEPKSSNAGRNDGNSVPLIRRICNNPVLLGPAMQEVQRVDFSESSV